MTLVRSSAAMAFVFSGSMFSLHGSIGRRELTHAFRALQNPKVTPVSAVAEATGNLGLRLRYNGSLTQHFCYDKDENGSAKAPAQE